ncbi:dipeptidase PepE [Helicobacter bizzozeronii]|uniref:Type 1 glutamine amidotransferase-like domain-containing protein n=1 Tax=Helicobacter bizzozeronii TaxID=56877 RepID=UPI00244D9354|nr:Type 1 glutamine amidotransferase-like domain-containing protein [Helicobacter bizzozeronii]GMB93360.1 dipeptidase PepE [Helicobacter bizzozeronii]
MPSLLLLSSACYRGAFLTHALGILQDFIRQHRLEGQTLGFVPFASVLKETYTQEVQEALKSLPVQIVGVHSDFSLLDRCGGFLMGEGNSFKLLHDLYAYNLLDKIAQRVRQGVPYLGWSAGANQERLAEFLTLNPSSVVDALPDGACLWVQEGQARYLHPHNIPMLQITHPYNATPLSPGATFGL